MRTCLISDCAKIGRTFEALGPFIGTKTPRPYECPQDHDAQSFALELSERLRGASHVLIGFGNNHASNTMRTLLGASRSHPCGVAMNLEGYRGIMDSMEALDGSERGHLRRRINVMILIGDHQDCFQGIGDCFPNARTHHIGGLHWADTTCKRMAEFLRGESVSQVA
jgi:hypothetical protein